MSSSNIEATDGTIRQTGPTSKQRVSSFFGERAKLIDQMRREERRGRANEKHRSSRKLLSEMSDAHRLDEDWRQNRRKYGP